MYFYFSAQSSLSEVNQMFHTSVRDITVLQNSFSVLQITRVVLVSIHTVLFNVRLQIILP